MNKRTLEKPAAAKKPATKRTKTPETDEMCPIQSISWRVMVIDDEEGDEDDEVYKSIGNPISNTKLKFKAPARAKWFTLRKDIDSMNFGPSFDMKDGSEYNYDVTEDGDFSYEEAMDIM